MLAPVSRPPTYKPHIVHLRMPVHQEVATRRVLILADPRLRNRRVFQARESPTHILANLLDFVLSYDPRLRVWIHPCAVLVEPNLQAPVLQIRHAVRFIGLEKKSWQRRRRESFVSRG